MFQKMLQAGSGGESETLGKIQAKLLCSIANGTSTSAKTETTTAPITDFDYLLITHSSFIATSDDTLGSVDIGMVGMRIVPTSDFVSASSGVILTWYSSGSTSSKQTTVKYVSDTQISAQKDASLDRTVRIYGLRVVKNEN